jgi:hypothetical protein
MLHADHAYSGHPAHPEDQAASRRGIGVELRVHGRDPDVAQAAAERLGCRVLVPAVDKGHGLREVFLIDTDGYLWVADRPLDPNPPRLETVASSPRTPSLIESEGDRRSGGSR